MSNHTACDVASKRATRSTLLCVLAVLAVAGESVGDLRRDRPEVAGSIPILCFQFFPVPICVPNTHCRGAALQLMAAQKDSLGQTQAIAPILGKSALRSRAEGCA